MLELWNSDGGTAWWNSGTVMVKQWNSVTVIVEQWKSDGGAVWWDSEAVIVEQCGGTVEQ